MLTFQSLVTCTSIQMNRELYNQLTCTNVHVPNTTESLQWHESILTFEENVQLQLAQDASDTQTMLDGSLPCLSEATIHIESRVTIYESVPGIQ